MLGQRDKRVARRQRALEELLWLDPVERERRIIAAVAAGDFSADEVEASLRLVARLDKLREMDLPGSGRLIGTLGPRQAALTSSENVEPGIEEEPLEVGGSNDEYPDGEFVGIPIVTEPVEVNVTPDYIGVPIVPEEPEFSAELPLDALESAERWEARSHQTSFSPALATRAAEPRAEWDMPIESAALPSAEDSAPSISWLRPN